MLLRFIGTDYVGLPRGNKYDIDIYCATNHIRIRYLDR